MAVTPAKVSRRCLDVAADTSPAPAPTPSSAAAAAAAAAVVDTFADADIVQVLSSTTIRQALRRRHLG